MDEYDPLELDEGDEALRDLAEEQEWLENGPALSFRVANNWPRWREWSKNDVDTHPEWAHRVWCQCSHLFTSHHHGHCVLGCRCSRFVERAQGTPRGPRTESYADLSERESAQ